MNIHTERLVRFLQLDDEEQRAAATRFLSSIQRFAARELTPDDVLVRGCLLCNDQRDHYYSRFSREALDEVAEMLPGRPVADSHNYRLRAEGRFFDAKVTKRDGVRWVEALFYLPNTERGKEVAQRIDVGVDREVSIGWNCLDATCGVCGEHIARCGHIPGDIYEGTGFCTYEFGAITNAFEGSLVLAGGQKDTTTFVPDGARRGFASSSFGLSWRELPTIKAQYHQHVQVPVPGSGVDGIVLGGEHEERGIFEDLFGPEPVPGIRHLVHCVEIAAERGERSDAAAWVREHGFRANRYEQDGGVHRFTQFAHGDVEGRKLVRVKLDDGVHALAYRSKERRTAEGQAEKSEVERMLES